MILIFNNTTHVKYTGRFTLNFIHIKENHLDQFNLPFLIIFILQTKGQR